MGRKEARLAAALEKNAAVECHKIQKRYVPELMTYFSETDDPRNRSYITYSNRIMLSTLYYKGIGGIVSMQEMTTQFNKEIVVSNIYSLTGEEAREYLPHHVTVNEYLERLDPKELEGVLHRICYESIRRKSFNDARYRKKWLVIVDGTQTYEGPVQLNDQCLESHHNKGTDKEKVRFHVDVLEAKIYLGEGLLLSIGSEFIQNDETYQAVKGKGEDAVKQDCETKAFKRLAKKIKSKYPRLPIILMGDSLYASEPVLQICEENGWDYIIRYKDGSIPSIAEEYELIPEKEKAGQAEYVNDIDYKGRKINVLRFRERRMEAGKEKEKRFQWLTSIQLTKKNAEKTAQTGRLRWKIENEGFNRQKQWQGDITHACSHEMNALKNHYLMQQISDFIKQLYEWYYLKKAGIERKQKNISSELLASFGRQLTGEDIYNKKLKSKGFV
ncbi:MAG: transposase [Lachnospiraceae bacterium]|nr:transposase [Lachnospiraceae bacterium]